MTLHRLTSVTIGVPNVQEAAAYYADCGLKPNGDGTFQTLDGGEQFRIVHAQRRMMLEMRVGADDPDDLDRIVGQLGAIDVDVERLPTSLQTRDLSTGVSVVVEIAARLEQPTLTPTPYNGPGRNERLNTRAPALLRLDEVGRGAMQMLEDHPERHVWGLGRHYIGSNFFWYLCDPAGNFTENCSDMDCIVDDQLWNPEAFEAGPRSLFSWAPLPPPSFIIPEDLAAHMVETQSGR